MRNIFYLLFVISIVSCTHKNPQKTTIRGTITDNTIDTIYLLIDSKKIPIPVIETGSFQIEYSNNKSTYCCIEFSDKIPLYINPGSTIQIQITKDSILFSGNCSEMCNFLQLRKENYKKVMSGFKDNKVFALSEQDFVQTIDSFTNELSKPVQGLIEEKSVPQEFIIMEQKRLKYWKYDMLSTYHRYSPTFTQKTVLPSHGYFDFVESVNFNDTSLFIFDEYKEFLYSYILGESFIKSTADSLTNDQQSELMLFMVEQQLKNQKIHDYVILRVMKRLLYSLQLNDNFLNNYKDKYISIQGFDEILKEYEKVKYLSKGNVAPDFTAQDINGNEVKLSDFKGEIVYVDIWSPFCAPCVYEFAFCHKLQVEFKGENIAFLSLCLDENKNRWMDNIERYHLKGRLLRANEGWKSEIMKQYAIKGVPKFILIDEEGNIISANAPYPSDVSLKTLINEYL